MIVYQLLLKHSVKAEIIKIFENLEVKNIFIYILRIRKTMVQFQQDANENDDLFPVFYSQKFLHL